MYMKIVFSPDTVQFCVICLTTGCGTLQEVCVEELKPAMDPLRTQCILSCLLLLMDITQVCFFSQSVCTKLNRISLTQETVFVPF